MSVSDDLPAWVDALELREWAIVLLLPWAGLVLAEAFMSSWEPGVVAGVLGSASVLAMVRGAVAEDRLRRLRDEPLAALEDREP